LCRRRAANLSFRYTGVAEMPVPKKRSLIAIVDDDEDVREAIRGLMRAVGFSAEAFSSGDEFLHSSLVKRTACLIADVNMPGMSGLDLCRRLSELGHATPTILITAYPTDDIRLRARAAGVVKLLIKPFVEADLVDSVRIALADNSI
jgi:FixJ family two-component response regulator